MQDGMPSREEFIESYLMVHPQEDGDFPSRLYDAIVNSPDDELYQQIEEILGDQKGVNQYLK